MSDNDETVVVDTPTITAKDPKKVEQGKRLAAISKEAKEKKMRAKIKEEDFSYLPWIGYGIATVSSLGLMYMFLFGKSKSEPELEKVVYEMKSNPQSPVKKKKFESF